MPTPAPNPPTGVDLVIYKGGIKASQIRVDLEVEYPHVTSLLSTVGGDSWYTNIPEGTSITGGLIKNDVSPAVFGVLRPASMWTKEGIVFPADKTIPWTLKIGRASCRERV